MIEWVGSRTMRNVATRRTADACSRFRSMSVILGVTWIAVCSGTPAGQVGNTFFDATDHPAIEYATSSNDPVQRLIERLDDGSTRLTFDDEHGYLPSLLAALGIATESQLLVFSKTSLQSALISPANPRAVYFTDSVAVAWPPGGFIEVAAQDPRQGVRFYTLEQRQVERPRLTSGRGCLTCHYSYATLNVPGMLVRSIPTDRTGRTLPMLANHVTDHRSALDERWGGWYVTGDAASARHLGNITLHDGPELPSGVTPRPSAIASLAPVFESRRHLTPYSDIAAQMVFDHQMHMTNLLTRAGWEVRVAFADQRADLPTVIADWAKELVDYMLFADEAPLPGPLRGTSGFAARFGARGPHDRSGRSLRELDLKTRLMRYPCSYMIYSEAFDALPGALKEAAYARLWRMLSAEEQSGRYVGLSDRTTRLAILQILRDTKEDLPQYMR